MREQLAAQAHAQHRELALHGRPQQRGLGAQARLVVDVEHRLLAAERQDPVDLGEVGQRVAAADVALVEHDASSLEDGTGVAEERLFEVVQDGDDGSGHASG